MKDTQLFDRMTDELIEAYGAVLHNRSFSGENILVELSLKFGFNIRLIRDRGSSTIEVAAHRDHNNWIPLSFLDDLISSPTTINSSAKPRKSLEDLYSFLRSNFELIVDWFSEPNYKANLEELQKRLKDAFNKNFPGMVSE